MKSKNKFLRLCYYKLIVPMKRDNQDPNYMARSTAIGMGGAFAPFIGQTWALIALWFIFKRTRFNFSLIITCAWSWLSNGFTNFPLFYSYYIIGAKILGKESISGYEEFLPLFKDNILEGLGKLIEIYGYSILIGSSLYMAVFGVIGYFGGRYFSKKWSSNSKGN
jgi:uncharacterized protein (DUF2062 family)